MTGSGEEALSAVWRNRRTVLLCFIAWIAGAVLTLYSYNLIAKIYPGRVPVALWENLASASFLIFGAIVALAVILSRLGVVTKVLLVGLFVSLSLLFSFAMGIHSMCGDEPTYIGESPKLDEESCGA
jgi:uncharacterized membrane protein